MKLIVMIYKYLHSKINSPLTLNPLPLWGEEINLNNVKKI